VLIVVASGVTLMAPEVRQMRAGTAAGAPAAEAVAEAAPAVAGSTAA